MSGTHKLYGESRISHPEVFTTIPPPVTEKKPGQLSQDQIKQYFEDVSVPQYHL